MKLGQIHWHTRHSVLNYHYLICFYRLLCVPVFLFLCYCNFSPRPCLGWDEGCMTMCQGEKSLLCIAGKKGYGKDGFPAWKYPFFNFSNYQTLNRYHYKMLRVTFVRSRWSSNGCGQTDLSLQLFSSLSFLIVNARWRRCCVHIASTKDYWTMEREGVWSKWETGYGRRDCHLCGH